MPFLLPTDVFNRSHYFLARGVAAVRETEHSRLSVLSGATSTGFYTPFFQAAKEETPTALLFYERELGPLGRLYSHNIIAERRTSIQSLRWVPHPSLELALAGGVGGEKGFIAASVELRAPWLKLSASYGQTGREFRRLAAEGLSIAETDRGNLRVQFIPHRSLHLTLSRQHYVSPSDTASPGIRSTVNGAAAFLSLGGFQVNGSVYASDGPFGRARATSAGVGRTLFGAIQAEVNYYETTASRGPVMRTVVAQLHETLSPRVRLTQLLTRSNGQTTVNWGGQLTLSRLTVRVDYQTIFLPFAPIGQSQVRQAVVLNVRLPLLRDIRLNATTNVDPLGSLQYTGYVNAFAHRTRAPGRSSTPERGTFHKYVIRGHVVDAAGEPVAGAALRIGEELAFADSRGAFEVYKKRAADYPLKVALDDFMFPGRYEVVSAPEAVRAAPEPEAGQVKVVLRRAP